MTDAAQQRIDHGRVAEEVAPFVVAQICDDDRGVAMIALLRQLEEDVGLFGLQRRVCNRAGDRQAAFSSGPTQGIKLCPVPRLLLNGAEA